MPLLIVTSCLCEQLFRSKKKLTLCAVAKSPCVLPSLHLAVSSRHLSDHAQRIPNGVMKHFLNSRLAANKVRERHIKHRREKESSEKCHTTCEIVSRRPRHARTERRNDALVSLRNGEQSSTQDEDQDHLLHDYWIDLSACLSGSWRMIRTVCVIGLCFKGSYCWMVLRSSIPFVKRLIDASSLTMYDRHVSWQRSVT